MTMPGKQIHIRLPDDLAAAFDHLCEELPGLQPGAPCSGGLFVDQPWKLYPRAGFHRGRSIEEDAEAQEFSRRPQLKRATNHTKRIDMAITVTCPSCGKQASLPDSALGRNVRCGCGQDFSTRPDTDSSTPDGTLTQIFATCPACGQQSEGYRIPDGRFLCPARRLPFRALIESGSPSKRVLKRNDCV